MTRPGRHAMTAILLLAIVLGPMTSGCAETLEEVDPGLASQPVTMEHLPDLLPVCVTDRWLLWGAAEVLTPYTRVQTQLIHYYRQPVGGGDLVFLGTITAHGVHPVATVLEDGRLLVAARGVVFLGDTNRHVESLGHLQVNGKRTRERQAFPNGLVVNTWNPERTYFVPLRNGRPEPSAAIALFRPAPEGLGETRDHRRYGDLIAWIERPDLCVRNVRTGELRIVELTDPDGQPPGKLLDFDGETVIVGDRAFDVATGRRLPAEPTLPSYHPRRVHDRFAYHIEQLRDEAGSWTDDVHIVAVDLMQRSSTPQVLKKVALPRDQKSNRNIFVSPNGLLVWDGRRLIRIPFATPTVP